MDISSQRSLTSRPNHNDHSSSRLDVSHTQFVWDSRYASHPSSNKNVPATQTVVKLGLCDLNIVTPWVQEKTGADGDRYIGRLWSYRWSYRRTCRELTNGLF